MSESTFTLRTLVADDIFMMCKIISKIGLREIGKCFETPEAEKAIDDNTVSVKEVGISVGIDIAAVLVEHLPDCRDDLYKFLAGLCDKQPPNIASMLPGQFIRLIRSLGQNEGFADFIEAVSELFGQGTVASLTSFFSVTPTP